jgi:hypothetical protein
MQSKFSHWMHKERNRQVTLRQLFPGFMNDALTFVRPVVSLDAAHLRSKYMGTTLHCVQCYPETMMCLQLDY